MLDCYLFPFLFRQGASDVDGDALILFHPPPEGQAWQRRMQRWLTFRAVPAALPHMHVTPNEYIHLFNGATCKLYFIIYYKLILLYNFAHAQNKSQAHL